MTAEIAIMNRVCVALAADSAVTIGKKKVWKSANKLFSLSPFNDIGIMIYGSGDFLGLSWEVIAKSFREDIGNQRFESVEQCAEKFKEYLASDKLSNEKLEKLSVLLLILSGLKNLGDNLEYTSKLNFREKLSEKIEQDTNEIERNLENLDCCLSLQDFKQKFETDILNLAKEHFDQHITKRILTLLVEFFFKAFCYTVETDYSTGVVIAGYGTNQLRPELIDLTVDGRMGDFVRVWTNGKRDLNQPDAPTAIVVPFAQSDMFQLFMEGITHSHRSFVRRTLEAVLNNKSDTIVKNYVSNKDERKVEKAMQRNDNKTILEEFIKEFSKHIQKEMINPVVRVISTLPKDEMAAMAEALVEITTLRRKVDSTVESVGGPTDVAVISKGDGLVWVKRKHYFDIEINKDFVQRKQIKWEQLT